MQPTDGFDFPAGKPYTRDPEKRKQVAFDAVKWVLRSEQVP